MAPRKHNEQTVLQGEYKTGNACSNTSRSFSNGLMYAAMSQHCKFKEGSLNGSFAGPAILSPLGVNT